MKARRPFRCATLVGTLAWAWANLAGAAGPTGGTPPAPASELRSFAPAPLFYHGSLDRIAFGGHGELHFAHDRVLGVADPEWFSFGRVSGFALARLGRRVELAGAAAWDPGADAFVLERAELGVRLGRALQAHAGIFLVPLGRTNLTHDAPRNEFAERSLVATELIGVPHAQLGAGIRGVSGGRNPSYFSYEIDLVTGYGDGVVMDAAGGTRVPGGRNNYTDNNGVPALAARLAFHPSSQSEFGLAAQSGKYNNTHLGGVQVDEPRYVHVVVADGGASVAGFEFFGEAALALIDVPPGLAGLFAERQWGAALEAVRTLREPLFAAWKFSRLALAVRADAVDFDTAIEGDSRRRLSVSLNLHRRPFAVTRLGWYYEIQHDRFNNDTPLAGVIFTIASYF